MADDVTGVTSENTVKWRDEDALENLAISEQAYAYLMRAGFKLISEVKAAPLARLQTILGERSLLSVLRNPRIGRFEEATIVDGSKTFTVVDEATGEKIGDVSLGQCKQLMGLQATADYFNFASVRELNEGFDNGLRVDDSGNTVSFTYEDLARFKIGVRMAKERKQPGPAAKSSRAAKRKGTGEDLVIEVDAEVARISKDFDTTQWLATDLEDVRRLAEMMVLHRRVNLAMLQADITADRSAAAALKELSAQSASLSKEITRYKNDLGISITARSEAAKGKTPDQVITDVVRDFKSLVADRVNIPQCCGVALLTFHPFYPKNVLTEYIEVVCPRCHKPVKVKLVTKKMLETHIEAGDFVPDGAPDGVFNRKGEL